MILNQQVTKKKLIVSILSITVSYRAYIKISFWKYNIW